MASTTTRAEIERSIAELAEFYGWSHHRSRCPGLRCAGFADGFPEHTLIRGGQLVFLVIAGTKCALTPPRARWVGELRRVRSIEAHVLGPDDVDALGRLLVAEDGP